MWTIEQEQEDQRKEQEEQGQERSLFVALSCGKFPRLQKQLFCMTSIVSR